MIGKAYGKIVGMLNIRHYLNDFLTIYGGHIGYGIRLSERGKGYVKNILKLALEYCGSIDLIRVMLDCYKDNKASRKTIISCGGKLEREFVDVYGKNVQIYWIEI